MLSTKEKVSLLETIVELEDHNVRAFEPLHRVPFRDLW
eukprot:COSAG01_NODE_2238_length_8089_cov_5.948936_4_plen_38_part_00